MASTPPGCPILHWSPLGGWTWEIHQTRTLPPISWLLTSMCHFLYWCLIVHMRRIIAPFEKFTRLNKTPFIIFLALVGNSGRIPAECCKFRSSKRRSIVILLVFFQWEDVPWLHMTLTEFKNKQLEPYHAINPTNIQSERNGNYDRMEKCGHTQHAACMLIVVYCRWCHHPHIRL